MNKRTTLQQLLADLRTALIFKDTQAGLELLDLLTQHIEQHTDLR